MIDPDSTKADLVVTLVPAGGGSALPGHIANERFAGQARNSFTLEDLAQGRVSFVHTDAKVNTLGLRISDGRENGNTAYVDIVTFKLQIYGVNNTGLVLPMGTSAIISSYNLTYTTNAPDQNINLRYLCEILNEFIYTSIEKRKASMKVESANKSSRH